MRRAGMDYIERAAITRHISWNEFQSANRARLILLTTQAATSYATFSFEKDDILLLGRESAGVPPAVHDAVHDSVLIPMTPGARSLNVALAAAMVLGEALHQLDEFP